MCFALLHFLSKLWKNGQGISNDTEVGDREDRCVLIFVDGDNILGAFPACQVLNCSTDTTGNIERWFHCLGRVSTMPVPCCGSVAVTTLSPPQGTVTWSDSPSNFRSVASVIRPILLRTLRRAAISRRS